jgi:hypothetical protein
MAEAAMSKLKRIFFMLFFYLVFVIANLKLFTGHCLVKTGEAEKLRGEVLALISHPVFKQIYKPLHNQSDGIIADETCSDAVFVRCAVKTEINKFGQ